VGFEVGLCVLDERGELGVVEECGTLVRSFPLSRSRTAPGCGVNPAQSKQAPRPLAAPMHPPAGLSRRGCQQGTYEGEDEQGGPETRWHCWLLVAGSPGRAVNPVSGLPGGRRLAEPWREVKGGFGVTLDVTRVAYPLCVPAVSPGHMEEPW
jgi:hypothetical protein